MAFSALSRINTLLSTAGSWLRSPLLLVIRVYWGWQLTMVFE